MFQTSTLISRRAGYFLCVTLDLGVMLGFEYIVMAVSASRSVLAVVQKIKSGTRRGFLCRREK